MAPFWRLELPFRYAIYAAFTLLFLSGAAWLLADQQKDSFGAEVWQQISAYSLMLHGGTAMLALMLLGALFPLHIGRAWQAKKTVSPAARWSRQMPCSSQPPSGFIILARRNYGHGQAQFTLPLGCPCRRCSWCISRLAVNAVNW